MMSTSKKSCSTSNGAVAKDTSESLLRPGFTAETWESTDRCNCVKKHIKVIVFISVIVLVILTTTVIMVACLEQAKLLRCALAKSLEMPRKECGEVGTLEKLHRNSSSQNNQHDVRIAWNLTADFNTSYNTSEVLEEIQKKAYFTVQDAAYLAQAEQDWDTAWEIFHDSEGWVKEKGESLKTGQVYSKEYRGFGRVAKIQGYVEASPTDLFNLFVIEGRFSEWSPMIAESYLLRQVNDNTRIVYTVTRASAGGFVSPRDYVNIGHWKSSNNVTLYSITATKYSGKPDELYVRGENKAGLLFRPVRGRPNMCLFEWFTSADMKGWLPSWLVASGQVSSMLEFFSDVQQRVNDLGTEN